jgi:hypothetical protein
MAESFRIASRIVTVAPFLVVPLAFGGCSSSSSVTTPEAGSDAAYHDSGVKKDAAAHVDATHHDAHHVDSASADSGRDTGAHDTGPLLDSPSTDASDAGDAGDASALSCAGLTYCDGFEAYATGAIEGGTTLGPWATIVSRDAVMKVDTVNPYSGLKSLHILVPATPDASAEAVLTQHADGGLIAGNNMYGRAMLFYAKTDGGGLPLSVHSWIFNAQGKSTVDDGGVSMNLGGGGDQLQLNYHPPPPATEQSVVGGTMTAGVWHCIQWQYDGAGTPAADDANVWVDGELAVGVDAGKGWKFATPWNLFDFGFTHYQTLHNSIDVFLDDFALGPNMIPCP